PVPPGKHFFTAGKWRVLNRARWWKQPVDRATVIGHYWRRRGGHIQGKIDVWDDLPPFAWSGGVFCVDYSVGRRFRERLQGKKQEFVGALGALRWPERLLFFDDRKDAIPTEGFSLG
ncbi:MAG: hypothetical protein RMJ98_18830, partial [Myxococcales bacterium]|nr:hypothetical protein [Polyangiaceae bacterium]MDW8251356.1 hypothetical protein [Myxococcales bacterium]